MTAKNKLVNNIFIDRIDELEMLKLGLKNAKNYALIAPRRFGKTTLVNKAFEQISKEKDYLLISRAPLITH